MIKETALHKMFHSNYSGSPRIKINFRSIQMYMYSIIFIELSMWEYKYKVQLITKYSME